MNIVLVRVPEDGNAGVHSVFTQYESLGMGYIAAILRRAGHTVEILDSVAFGPNQELVTQLTLESRERLGGQVAQALSRGELASAEADWLLRKVYLAQQILAAQPDLVGFTLISSINYGHVGDFVRYLRSLGLTVPMVAGGEQASLYAADVLTRIPGLDACLKGEGEQTILEFIERLHDRSRWHEVPGLVWKDEAGLQRNQARPMIPDLDVLPFPARDHLSTILARGGETVVSASRGCWAKCTFCSIIEFFDHATGAAWRTRSPENIVAELRHLYETYGADRFWFVDDEFFNKGAQGRERAEEVFRQIAAAKLPIRLDFFCRAGDLAHYGPKGTFDLAVAAGLRRIFCGIESGSQEALKRFNKGSHPTINRAAITEAERRGVDLLCEFILFNPWSTLDQIEDCLSFLTTVPRGIGQEVGKHDPMILSSSLYIHRETPLGRHFVTNHPELRDHDSEATGDDFYVPYRFACPRVQVLHDVVTATMQRFAPLETALEQLLRLTDRLWLPAWSERLDAHEVRALYAHHSGILDALKADRADLALDFFREAFAFVKDYPLKENDVSLARFRATADGLARRQTFEADNVVEYFYSVTVARIAEVWDVLSQRNLLGPRMEPPACLERR